MRWSRTPRSKRAPARSASASTPRARAISASSRASSATGRSSRSGRTAALEIITVEELEPHGLAAPHVVANILAASALVRSFGVPVGVIHDALGEFRLDAHRIETVAVAGGIRWIDDSKATNPHAAEASLRAFGSVVWVVGGLLKGVDADALVAAHVERLRAAIVIGVDRGALVGGVPPTRARTAALRGGVG